jgi:hypothetical protein
MHKRHRHALTWYLVGFLTVQLGLGACIDCYWPALRDPDFAELKQIVRARQAATPGRPLVLVFGSSRTQSDLRAEWLNDALDSTAPVVINCAVLGGGPMMHEIMLRRFLDVGIRPELAFVEIMPMALSARQGFPIEELQQTWRYTAGEVRQLWPYYAEPIRLCYHWGITRAFPFFHYQAQMRDVLGIDVPAAANPRFASGRDEYGWVRSAETIPRQERERLTRENLAFYHDALTEPALAPGALKALHDLLDVCLRERISLVLVLPPEGSAFRSYAPAVEECHIEAIHAVAGRSGVPVVDARSWVDDSGFYDGHHALISGADQFTRRFARDALAPHRALLPATGGSSPMVSQIKYRPVSRERGARSIR